MSGGERPTPVPVALEIRELFERTFVMHLVENRVPVEPEDLREQLMPEAVHHGHHDDQRSNAEHDAEERETGDDRDESFLAARPQVASGQQPFEGGEGWGSNWLAHDIIRGPTPIRIGLIVAASHRMRR